jgi:hypothetical protein
LRLNLLNSKERPKDKIFPLKKINRRKITKGVQVIIFLKILKNQKGYQRMKFYGILSKIERGKKIKRGTKVKFSWSKFPGGSYTSRTIP